MSGNEYAFNKSSRTTATNNQANGAGGGDATERIHINAA